MKYIRTKDGRIVEEHNLELGFKQTIITIKNKKDNKELTQIVCDDLDDYLEMVVVGEYCKCHKINPKDIKYETITLFNEVLKEADTIEELCDEFVLVGEKIAPKHSFLTFEQAKFNFKSLINQTYVEFAIYGAIWTNEGLTYVAKLNSQGELELL